MSLFKKIKSFFVKKEEIVVKPKAQRKVKLLTAAEIKAKEERANRLLKEQLRKEKEQSRKNQEKIKPKSKSVPEPSRKKKKLRRKQRITISEKEQEAEDLATKQDTILFISATTKRLRAIEWRKAKKRIILSKEREIRRTHKGGFSQEKFQHFVDSQKAKTAEWIETNLKKPGVLRGPYNKIIIEATDEKVEKVIKRIVKDY